MLAPPLGPVAGLLEPPQRLIEIGDDDREVPDRRDDRILARHQVDLSSLPFDPGVLPQRLRRLDPLEPEQLEEAGSCLDVGGRDLDANVVEHAEEFTEALQLRMLLSATVEPWRQP
jgi:hypothetical protein